MQDMIIADIVKRGTINSIRPIRVLRLIHSAIRTVYSVPKITLLIPPMTGNIDIAKRAYRTIFFSQNLGAKQIKRAKKGFNYGFLLNMIYGAIISVVIFLVKKPILNLFISSDESNDCTIIEKAEIGVLT